MIIFKDAFSGEEFFTDSQKICKDCDEELLEVTCCKVVEESKNDFDIGANASQEEQAEQLEVNVCEGIDLVLRHELEEVTGLYGKKSDYLKFLKVYCKRVLDKMTAEGCCPEKIESFKKAGQVLAKHVQENFKQIQFFTPKANYEKEEDPFVAPLYMSPTGDKITMMFLKSGLQEEKC